MDRLQMALYVCSLKATIDLSLALLSQSPAYFSGLQSASPQGTKGLEAFFWGFIPQAFFLVSFVTQKNSYFKRGDNFYNLWWNGSILMKIWTNETQIRTTDTCISNDLHSRVFLLFFLSFFSLIRMKTFAFKHSQQQNRIGANVLTSLIQRHW